MPEQALSGKAAWSLGRLLQDQHRPKRVRMVRGSRAVNDVQHTLLSHYTSVLLADSVVNLLQGPADSEC